MDLIHHIRRMLAYISDIPFGTAQDNTSNYRESLDSIFSI